METSFDLPDSTDWLGTPLSLLAPLESSLRCQVCKDFFDNPVITSCSHTFCSLCIRRCLSSEGKCPACRSSDQETKLRRNWAVQELVEAFANARPGVLDLARKARDADQNRDQELGQQRASKRRRIVEQSHVEGEDAGAEGILTRSQRRTDDRPLPTMVDLVEDSQDEDYVPEDGLVACPVCRKRMKEEVVFQHLDTCNGDSAPSKQASFGSLQPMSPVSRKHFKPIVEKQPDRLPVINYSILKEGVLRKKLKELGIPNWGPRPLIQRRHTEWMNLWNANCDSISPKSKNELLRELDAWERTQGGNANSSFESTHKVMGKGFDPEAWSTSHGDEFKRLIENARKKTDAVRKTTPQAPVASDEAERTPVPERPMERPIVTGEIPGESLLYSSHPEQIRNMAFPPELPSLRTRPSRP